jgi:hypothetical protein
VGNLPVIVARELRDREHLSLALAGAGSMIKPEKGRISFIVGPDGELCSVDANGHWCNDPENEASQKHSPVGSVEGGIRVDSE